MDRGVVLVWSLVMSAFAFASLLTGVALLRGRRLFGPARGRLAGWNSVTGGRWCGLGALMFGAGTAGWALCLGAGASWAFWPSFALLLTGMVVDLVTTQVGRSNSRGPQEQLIGR